MQRIIVAIQANWSVYPSSGSPSGCHLKVNCPKGAREATLGCPPGEGLCTINYNLNTTPFHKSVKNYIAFCYS